MRKVVVLPAPFGPSSPTISPGATLDRDSADDRAPPNRFSSLRAERIGSAAGDLVHLRIRIGQKKTIAARPTM